MFNKHFAIIASVIFILILFQPVVQAQLENTSNNIDVNLQPIIPPGTQNYYINNIGGNQDNISTEINIWEKDLGKQATEGSYVGPLFESSVFTIDFTPLKENKAFTFSNDLNFSEINNNLNWRQYWSPYLKTWPSIYDINATSIYGTNISTAEYKINPTYSFPTAKTRSITSIIQIVNFSNRVIMSGATEFWVKIPIRSSCINFNELLPTISFTSLYTGEVFNQDKLWLTGQPKITYSPLQTYTNWKEYINNDTALYSGNYGDIIKQYNGYEDIKTIYDGREPDIVSSINEKYIIGESIYAKIYAVIKPNTNYVATFSAIIDSKPNIFITEEDLYNSGRASFIKITDITFTNSSIKYYDSSIGEIYRPIVEISTENFQIIPPVNSTIEIPLDISFSFIFLSGLGNNGMYGQHFNMKKDSSLVFYKTITPTTDKYISVMIPFISDQSILINATVEFLELGETTTTARYNKFELQGTIFNSITPGVNNTTIITPTFGYKSPYWWQSESSQTYNDYILFTVPYKVSTKYSIAPKNIRIIITFVKETNLTFMFSSLTTSDLYSSIIDTTGRVFDMEFVNYPLSMNSIIKQLPSKQIRNKITYIYQNTTTQPIFYQGWDFKESYDINPVFNPLNYWGEGLLTSFDEVSKLSNINNYEIINSELFCTIQLTDGMWHQLVTTSNGFQYATNYFERRIAIGLIEFYIDPSNRQFARFSGGVNGNNIGNGEFALAWNSFTSGDILGAIYHSVAGAASMIWDGLSFVGGLISGAFNYVWDVLSKIGSFLITTLMGFIDSIISFINDIVGAAERILNIAVYVISIILFAYIISWTGRFIYITKRGLNA